MKKINFYCGKVDSQGGSKISLLNTLFLFKRENIKFEIFVNKEGCFTKQLTQKKIDYTIINEPKPIEKIDRSTNLFFRILYFITALPKLMWNWIKVNRKISNEDKVILNESRDLVLFLPALLRHKVETIQWIRSEHVGKVSKFLIKKVDKIIAVSDIVKKNIVGETNKPIYRIHNFMLEKPFTKKDKSLDTNIINIAIVGSIQKIKGQLDAIKVLNYIKNERILSLHIIGREFDEQYTKRVKEYIKQYDLEKNVKFLGHVDNVPKYLNKYIHLTLIPSQTESFCRVAMESISVGIPVIAYKVGGLKEVVLESETGFLVEKDNIISMSESVDNILSDKKLYKYLSDRAIKDWESRFYSESIKKELFDVLT